MKDDAKLDKVTVILQDAVAMGGAEFLMLGLVNEWQKRGVAVKVFTILRELLGRLKMQGVEAVFIPFRLDVAGGWKGAVKFFLFLPLAIFYYFNLLKSEKERGSRLVLTSGFSDKMVVSPLGAVLGMTVVWIEFGPLGPIFSRNAYLPKLLYQMVKHLPARVITLAENTKKSLMRDGGFCENRLGVIQGGVEEKTVKDLKDLRQKGERLKRELRVEGKVIVGNLSRVAREKGQWDLISVFSKTRGARAGKAVLVLVGEGPDLVNLRERVKNEGLAERVKILGWREDKWEFYGSLDIFVFPSEWELEGFGLVMCEAMMCEVPVIGVAAGPVPEVIEGGKTGLVVEKNSLGEAMDKLVYNRGLRRRLGEAGGEKVRRDNGLFVVAEKFYGQLVEAVSLR